MNRAIDNPEFVRVGDDPHLSLEKAGGSTSFGNWDSNGYYRALSFGFGDIHFSAYQVPATLPEPHRVSHSNR